MKNIKDITISIFAIIGFVAIVSGFTTNETKSESQQMYGTPESHVWEMKVSETDNGRVYIYNKVTGEVRKYAASTIYAGNKYISMKQLIPKEKKKK